MRCETCDGYGSVSTCCLAQITEEEHCVNCTEKCEGTECSACDGTGEREPTFEEMEDMREAELINKYEESKGN